MNRLKITFYLSIIISCVYFSCNEEDACPTINCNFGNFNEEICECDCPVGYIGENCESFNASQVQSLLDAGKTPKELYDGNISLDSLYGKMYKDGLIFYLNIDDGTGIVAEPNDRIEGAQWGCHGTDLPSLVNVTNWPEEMVIENGAKVGDGASNTQLIINDCEVNDNIAVKVCRALGEDWFLPSRDELYLMYMNLQKNGYGEFKPRWYWSSTEQSDVHAWIQHFEQENNQGVGMKVDAFRVRAAKYF